MQDQALSFGALSESFQALWSGVIATLPAIVLAIVFVLIGIIIGWLAKKAIQELFRALAVDRMLRGTGLDEMVRRAGYELHSGTFIGEIVRWFFIIVFTVFAFDIVNLTQITTFLNEIALSFLPNLIVAAGILFVGSILADAATKLIAGSVRATGHGNPGLIGNFVKWAIWVFTIVIALGQVGIAEFYVQTFFTALVFMIALAGAIAFGLGAKDYASRAMKRLEKMMQDDTK